MNGCAPDIVNTACLCLYCAISTGKVPILKEKGAKKGIGNKGAVILMNSPVISSVLIPVTGASVGPMVTGANVPVVGSHVSASVPKKTSNQ